MLHFPPLYCEIMSKILTKFVWNYENNYYLPSFSVGVWRKERARAESRGRARLQKINVEKQYQKCVLLDKNLCILISLFYLCIIFSNSAIRNHMKHLFLNLFGCFLNSRFVSGCHSAAGLSCQFCLDSSSARNTNGEKNITKSRRDQDSGVQDQIRLCKRWTSNVTLD